MEEKERRRDEGEERGSKRNERQRGRKRAGNRRDRQRRGKERVVNKVGQEVVSTDPDPSIAEAVMKTVILFPLLTASCSSLRMTRERE